MESDVSVPFLRSAWLDAVSWQFETGGRRRMGGGGFETSSQRVIVQRF